MPRLHLPRSPYNFWFHNISIQVFQAAVWVCVNILYTFCAILCHVSTTDKWNAVERPHRDCAVSTALHKNHTPPLRLPYGHCMGTIWQPCDCHAGAIRRTAILRFLFQNDHLKSCGCLMITSRPLHGGHTMLLRRVYRLQAYNFYFVYSSELYTTVEATETAQCPWNRTILYGCRTEMCI